jgi:hypothetical protein
LPNEFFLGLADLIQLRPPAQGLSFEFAIPEIPNYAGDADPE